jgi:hypothetical protein
MSELVCKKPREKRKAFANRPKISLCAIRLELGARQIRTFYNERRVGLAPSDNIILADGQNGINLEHRDFQLY